MRIVFAQTETVAVVSDTLVFKSAKSYVTLDHVGNNGKGWYKLIPYYRSFLKKLYINI